MTQTQDIIVVGGGIGGLAAACALAQAGRQVTLFEQAEAIKEVGAGLQISPNGMRVLRQLGVAAAITAISQKGARRQPAPRRKRCGSGAS